MKSYDIRSFYKKIDFQVVGPVDGKPVMLGDTCYFVSCRSIDEAEFIVELLNSEVARVLLESMIFWTNKRPITAELLKRLHIGNLLHIWTGPTNTNNLSINEMSHKSHSC